MSEDGQGTEVRAIITKASDMGLSNKLPEDPFSNMYGNQVIEPPFPLEFLARLAEMSEALGPCIEAMQVNVDGFGYRLEPTIELPEEPEEGELSQSEKDLRETMLQEKQEINRFFKFINYEESFTKIRKKTRKDYETIGFAFWEILKDGKGDIAGAEHLPAHTMRLCGLSEEPVEFKQKVKTGPDTIEEVTRWKRFRLFCQKKAGRTVYYKELNDPRTIDAETGKVREDLTPEEEENFKEAHEVVYFSQYNPRSPYGLPRWYNAMLSVLGSREAGEVNLQYFDGKTIPPMVALVKGGTLTSGSRERVEDHFKEVKGKDKFHSILVLEAKPSQQTNNPMDKGDVEIEIKPMTEAIYKDALFQEYDQSNRSKIRATFRIPPIYTGESEDYNKATSETARKIAEEQVFGPEREEFDSYINRLLMPKMDFKYWEFKTNSPNTSNNKDLSEMVAGLSKDSGLDINSARKIISGIFSTELESLDEDWADYPIPIAKLILTQQIREMSQQGQNLEKSAEDIAGNIVEKLFEIKKEVDRQVIEAGACKSGELVEYMNQHTNTSKGEGPSSPPKAGD